MALLIFTIAAIAILSLAFRGWRWLNPRPLKAHVPIDGEKKIWKQKYALNKVPRDLDAIIIGSGVSGLALAALLAKVSHKKVLVLEQHDVSGGTTHTWKKSGCEWETGVHYVGRDKMRLLNYLCDGKLQWKEMADIYDRAIFEADGLNIPFASGLAKFRAEMSKQFPDEVPTIERYITAVQRVVTASRLFFLAKIVPQPLRYFMQWWYLRYSDQTADAVLRQLFPGNAKIRAALSYLYGDYGLPPKEASWGIHALVAQHFWHGAMYPMDGTNSFSKAIIPTIEAAGGRVLTQANVTEIIVDRSGQACGVKVSSKKSDDTIPCKIIVSTTGVYNTYQKLLPARYLTASVQRSLAMLEPSCSHLYLFVKIDGEPQLYNFPRENTWWFQSTDLDSDLHRAYSDVHAPFAGVFVTFPCVHDEQGWLARCPGASNAIVITQAPYKLFQKWQNTVIRKRGDDYEALKQELTDRMLQHLYKVAPQVEGKVMYTNLGTPLTNEYYLAGVQGASFGVGATPQRFRCPILQPKTNVRGVYMSGQDVTALGFGGALASAVLTGITIDKHVLAPIIKHGI